MNHPQVFQSASTPGQHQYEGQNVLNRSTTPLAARLGHFLFQPAMHAHPLNKFSMEHQPRLRGHGFFRCGQLERRHGSCLFVIGPSCKSPGRWIFSSILLYRKPLQIEPFNLFLPYSIAGLGIEEKPYILAPFPMDWYPSADPRSEAR